MELFSYKKLNSWYLYIGISMFYADTIGANVHLTRSPSLYASNVNNDVEVNKSTFHPNNTHRNEGFGIQVGLVQLIWALPISCRWVRVRHDGFIGINGDDTFALGFLSKENPYMHV